MIARGQQNDRSKKRCWGQQGQLTSGQAGIIQMGCELERPGVVTVQFNVSGNGGVSVLPVATVFFKANGISVQRQVSVGNGTSISGVAEAVTVQVQDQTNQFFGTNTPPATTYNVAATVVPGVRAPTNQPPILMTPQGQLTVLPAGGSPLVVPIPQNAGVASAFITAQNTAPPVTPASSVVANFLSSQVQIYYETPTGLWVPVAPGAQAIQIANYGGTGSAAAIVSCLFGIDG